MRLVRVKPGGIASKISAKPAIEVIQFARQEAQRDCLDALMREVPTERKI
jgi:hypothetical protein